MKTKFTIGQRVLVASGDGPEAYVVTKVGRVWVYVQREGGFRERAFAAEGGYEKGDYSYGRFYTVEAWDDRWKRAEALDDLKKLGVHSLGDHYPLGSASSVTLRKIIDILKEA